MFQLLLRTLAITDTNKSMFFWVLMVVYFLTCLGGTVFSDGRTRYWFAGGGVVGFLLFLILGLKAFPL